MTIAKLFPAVDIVREASDQMPIEWSTVLSLPAGQALTHVADIIGIGPGSSIRQMLSDATDYGVLLPRRHRDLRDRRTWKLAVLYASDRAMLFSYPSPEFLMYTERLPDDYARAVRSLGAFRFDQYSGQLVWPSLLRKIGHEIESALADSRAGESVIPFYDHGTGDYDCWLGSDFEASWYYDHDIKAFSLCTRFGYMSWFEQRFKENLEV